MANETNSKIYSYDEDCKQQQLAFNKLPQKIQFQTFEYWALQKIATTRDLDKSETNRFFHLAEMCVEHDISPISAPAMYPFTDEECAAAL